jgi:lipopolysaccharide biosynthesis protein
MRSYVRLLLREINVSNIVRLIALVFDKKPLSLKLGEIERAISTLKGRSGQTWQPAQPLILTFENSSPVGKKNFAFFIHCFFPEFIPKTVNLIDFYRAHFPSVDFYVSASDVNVHNTLSIQLHGYENLKKLVLSQNRGRHFGPLLVEFSADALNYEFFVHLHSKKSTHMNKRQASHWADYNWEVLGEDPDKLFQLLKYMTIDESCALAHALDSSYFPPNVFTWASKKQDRVNHLGDVPSVHNSKDGERFPFPVGGMFMARTSDFKDLLSIDWSYSRFPEESGALHGEIQHDLERVIGFIPFSEGKKQLVFHVNLGVASTEETFTQ